MSFSLPVTLMGHVFLVSESTLFEKSCSLKALRKLQFSVKEMLETCAKNRQKLFHGLVL